MIIRRFTVNDAKTVIELNRAALAGTDAVPEDPAWDLDLHDIPSNYLMAGDFIVGIKASIVVAMGGFVLHPGSIAELKRLRVAPSFQRLGLGASLLLALEERALAAGASAAFAETTTVQWSAQRLYDAAGYEMIDRFENLGFQVLKYRKQLR
jgi:ribosomal protein S18 acetylase RimI-like enzyme